MVGANPCMNPVIATSIEGVAMDASLVGLDVAGMKLGKPVSEGFAKLAAKAGGGNVTKLLTWLGSKVGTKAVIPGAGWAILAVDALGYASEGVGALAYGDDYSDLRKDMMTDDEHMVNLGSMMYDGIADGLDFVCVGLSDVLHENVGEPLGEAVSQIPGIGDKLCAVGGFVEMLGGEIAHMPGGLVDSLKSASNVAGMAIGLAPVENNRVLEDDRRARERLVELLPQMEADGFAAPGTLDAILASRDEYFGKVCVGYSDILKTLEDVGGDGESFVTIYEHWKAGDEGYEWEFGDGEHVLDAGMFGALDTSVYESGMTDEMAEAVWLSATEMGLWGSETEMEMFSDEEISMLKYNVKAGKMSFAESGAYLAAYMDYQGMFDMEAMQACLASNGFYDALKDAAAAGGLQVDYTQPGNLEQVLAKGEKVGFGAYKAAGSYPVGTIPASAARLEAESGESVNMVADNVQASVSGTFDLDEGGSASEQIAQLNAGSVETEVPLDDDVTEDEAMDYLMVAYELGFVNDETMEWLCDKVDTGELAIVDAAYSVADLYGDDIDAALDELGSNGDYDGMQR